MNKQLIRFLVYAITMCILYAALDFLHNRDSGKNSAAETQYVVKLPGMLKNVYFIMFAFGLLLFAIFFFFRMKGNPTVTNAHLWFALAVAGIGLIVMIYASSWRVVVNGDEITVHRLLRKSETMAVTDIEKAEVGKKEQLILYKDGEKWLTIDYMADNYEIFRERLVRLGKVKQ